MGRHLRNELSQVRLSTWVTASRGTGSFIHHVQGMQSSGLVFFTFEGSGAGRWLLFYEELKALELGDSLRKSSFSATGLAASLPAEPLCSN